MTSARTAVATPPGTTTIAALLAASRARTLALLDLPEADQRAQVSPLMSPMVWDLAHIGNYEELWLLRAVDGRPALDASLDDLYNAFEHPRWERPGLPVLGPAEAREYLATVRAEVNHLLEETDLTERADGLRRGGFVYGMVIQHEHQHCETLLATRQLMGEGGPSVPGAVPAPPAASRPADDMVLIPGVERFEMGTDDDAWAYDNERPAHAVDVQPFWLDRHPVTNAAYRAFLLAGAYDDPAWWSAEGWAWRSSEPCLRPQAWSAGLDAVLRFGTWRPLADDEPVQHVCFHEVEAYARWSGKRLPTEAEWELAATWHPDGTKRRYPWGDDEPTARHANLGQRHDGPAPVGAYPDGANPWGVLGLIGDVWEWTSSTFEPYPGFQAFPYREYSEVFYGAGGGDDGYRVLRGGSWAADPVAVRGTFRNWDHPIRRQIFSGFRCARDA